MTITQPRTAIDPVTEQVIAGALESIAIEMGHKLARMSYSSIIRESEDFGAALLDVQGRQLCESVQSTPLQLGPIPGYMRGIFRLFKERGDEFYPGDVIIHNSPYHGSSHEPDVGFCVPVFHRGELVGFSFTTAHHLDVGALTPGSCGIVNATDAFAEGLQFLALKVYERGVRNEALWRMLRDNIRAPDLVVGDMEAQVAACRIGAERFVELIERYGMDLVLAASEARMNYSERMLRREIEGLPDGTYRAVGFIDGFQDHPDPAYKDLRIEVAVTVQGSDLTVDLTGTSPQIDLPLNMPLEGTVDVAVYLTVRSILLDSATHEHVPQNSGLTRPIRIVAPEGTLVNPRFPAPTIARFCPGNIVADTTMRALAQAAPDRVSAGVGNLKVIAYSGPQDGNYWVYMDITEGSYGGRPGRDGMDAVDTLYANTRNNPIEDIESHYPLRVRRYELREDAAGAGKWRGGVGSIRDVSFSAPGGLSLEGDGNCFAPWGIFGGQDGTTGAVIWNPGQPDERPVPSKFPYRGASPGDTIRTVSPCGGGYGDPLERDPARVLDDVLDGLVSAASARELYGVVLADGDGSGPAVDLEATEQLRARLRHVLA
ncbi:MAG: hydantoinase B/oxoprolinase family protein [Chloroflexi bacterium]|nr:hydantoinase B/oxoprolinase family protein [Chloroflexota bacterium]